MGAKEWAAALIAGGIALQVAGVVMVIWDLRATGALLKDYDTRNRSAFASAALGTGSSLSAEGEGGHEPSLEERVNQLETHVDDLPRQWTADIAKLDTRLSAEIQDAVSTTEQSLWVNQIQPLAKLVRTVFARRGVTSAALILLGLVVSALGSVWSVFIV